MRPVFPKEYKSKNFKIPNIVKIVDDAERRDISVCKGAIGYLGEKNKTEILYLYDEARDFSGLQFIPTFNVNSVYCMDTFDKTKKRFINVENVFNRTQAEKLAEL